MGDSRSRVSQLLPIFLLFSSLIHKMAASEESLDTWSLYDCKIPNHPSNHPIRTHTPSILNLYRTADLSGVSFWVSISGTSNLESSCNIGSGILYQVTRKGDVYNYSTYAQDSPDEDGKAASKGTVVASCSEYLVQVSPTSHGFISCTQSRAQAEASVAIWWRRVPIPYVAYVLIGVGVGFVLVLIGGVTICLVKRNLASKSIHLDTI